MSSKDKFLFSTPFCTKIHNGKAVFLKSLFSYETLFHLMILLPFKDHFLEVKSTFYATSLSVPFWIQMGHLVLDSQFPQSHILKNYWLHTFPLKYIFFYYIEFCKVFLFIMKWLMSFSWPFWLSTFSFHHAFAWGWKDVVQCNKWGDSIKSSAFHACSIISDIYNKVDEATLLPIHWVLGWWKDGGNYSRAGQHMNYSPWLLSPLLA